VRERKEKVFWVASFKDLGKTLEKQQLKKIIQKNAAKRQAIREGSRIYNPFYCLELDEVWSWTWACP